MLGLDVFQTVLIAASVLGGIFAYKRIVRNDLDHLQKTQDGIKDRLKTIETDIKEIFKAL